MRSLPKQGELWFQKMNWHWASGIGAALDYLLVACVGMSSQPHLTLWSTSVEPGWEINRKVSQRETKHSLPARGLIHLYVQENSRVPGFI